MNGNSLKIILLLAGIIVGSFTSTGYMACQLEPVEGRLDIHIEEQQVKEVENERRLTRIEAVLERVDRNVERLLQ